MSSFLAISGSCCQSQLLFFNMDQKKRILPLPKTRTRIEGRMPVAMVIWFSSVWTACATMLSGTSTEISKASAPSAQKIIVNKWPTGTTPLGFYFFQNVSDFTSPTSADTDSDSKNEDTDSSKPDEKNVNSEEVYGAFIDSIIFFGDIKEKTKNARMLLEEALKYYKTHNYLESRSISLFAWQDLATATIYRPMNNEANKIRIYPSGSRQVTSNSVLLEEGKTQRALLFTFLQSSFALQEEVWDSAGWFRYKAATFERWVEFDLLTWYKDAYDLDKFGKGEQSEQYKVRYKKNVLDKGPNFNYFTPKGVRSGKGIIKKIETSEGTLIVNMRADPEDIADYGRGEFKHPIGFMRHLSDFTRKMWTKYEWVSDGDMWRRNRYKAIHEIVFTLYYPGTDGNEFPIGKFGLNRLIGASINWKDYRVKDGTFQDLLKEKGIYWLHPEIPDMGMPSIH